MTTVWSTPQGIGVAAAQDDGSPDRNLHHDYS
jgi:hypothetical protein